MSGSSTMSGLRGIKTGGRARCGILAGGGPFAWGSVVTMPNCAFLRCASRKILISSSASRIMFFDSRSSNSFPISKTRSRSTAPTLAPNATRPRIEPGSGDSKAPAGGGTVGGAVVTPGIGVGKNARSGRFRSLASKRRSNSASRNDRSRPSGFGGGRSDAGSLVGGPRLSPAPFGIIFSGASSAVSPYAASRPPTLSRVLQACGHE